MRKTTAEIPTCMCSLLETVCKENGLPRYYEATIVDKAELYTKPTKKGRKPRLIAKSHDIKINAINGKQYPYMINGARSIIIDELIKSYDVTLEKTFEDLGFNPEDYRVGKYKDSDRGGWYCEVPLYCYKGVYYAAMSCTCSQRN